jgi:thiamine biosynthesis lipoprotein
MKKWFVVSLLFPLLFSSCNRKNSHRVSRDTTVMETFLTVSIYDPDISTERANALIDSIFADMGRIESSMTDYSDSSEVGVVNSHGGKDSVTVSNETVSVLKESVVWSERSGGAFDVTVGPIVKAWDFLASEPEIPSRSKLRVLRQLVGWKKLSISAQKVFLHEKGMRIDLGGIAKGYAVDRAIEILKRNGVKHTIVDLGGNLSVWWEGTHALDSSVAEILVRHPRKDGKFFGAFKAGTCGISTSGDYQRFFLKDGIRYHHIINPATGYPAKDVVSVTIIGRNAMQADVLSTLVFVLGREKGMKFLEKLEGVEGMIVWQEGEQLKYELSAGLRGKFARSND